ncbi:MAG: SDR family oxidoreductase [Coriobacteriia bacterium]|nr:SDR family oxidoreductase [Coriobacteriia bacterium]
MRLLVFGAAGRTGRLVVSKALGHGHEVTAFVHKRTLELQHERLRVVRGDVRDVAAVSEAVVGHSAIAFALSTSLGGTAVQEAGIANVIYAMAEKGVDRLSAVSCAGAFERNSPKLSIGRRLLVASALRGTYDDLEAMERRIMASDLDWTIVRPVGLSDTPATGHYRFSLDGSPLSDGKKVSRADVASLVVKSLETDTYWRRAVVIAS